MNLRAVLLEIHVALQRESIAHALIGGLALAAHGAARATVDLDLLAAGDRTDDVDRLLRERGYACLHRSENVANYASDEAASGRIDFLFARRRYGMGMRDRATSHRILGEEIPVVDAADLIGLKVQASYNDPARRHLDLADIARLLEVAPVDLERVREYFRLFDREKELDALLSSTETR